MTRIASAGLAPAQYRLAVLYERGQGVIKDLGRARSWYQAAAEKGNVKAMHNLAVSLSGHEDGDPDYALAAKWYGQAGAYGLADSQFNLAVLAEHGLGMPKNLGAAYQWFALAAKNGDQEAGKRRDMIKPELDAAALAAADQAVATWTAKQPPAESNEVDEQQDRADATGASAANIALVNRAQALLNKLGYDVGVPDGLMGAKTREAIKSFEDCQCASDRTRRPVEAGQEAVASGIDLPPSIACKLGPHSAVVLFHELAPAAVTELSGALDDRHQLIEIVALDDGVEPDAGDPDLAHARPHRPETAKGHWQT